MDNFIYTLGITNSESPSLKMNSQYGTLTYIEWLNKEKVHQQQFTTDKIDIEQDEEYDTVRLVRYYNLLDNTSLSELKTLMNRESDRKFGKYLRSLGFVQ